MLPIPITSPKDGDWDILFSTVDAEYLFLTVVTGSRFDACRGQHTSRYRAREVIALAGRPSPRVFSATRLCATSRQQATGETKFSHLRKMERG
jgi:hypothetical protein